MSHKDKTIFSNNQMPVGHFFFETLISIVSQSYNKILILSNIYYETFWGCPSFLTETINISNTYKSTTLINKSQIFLEKSLK
jgi:hypothetical protein